MTFSIFHLRYAGEVINHISFKFFSFGDPTFLIIAPLLWFYITELTGGRVKLNFSTAAHFLPFLVMIFASVSLRSLLADSGAILKLQEYPRLPITVFWITILIQSSVYQYLIHRKWHVYQALVRQELSDTEHVNIAWVEFFMTVFLLITVSFLFSLIAVVHLDITSWVWRIAGGVLSLSIFALGYKGILQRQIFDAHGEPEITPPLTSRTSGETPDQQQIEKLRAFMDNEKPYLDPELSLSTLAKAFGIKRNQLLNIDKTTASATTSTTL